MGLRKCFKYILVIFILLFSYDTYCDDYNITSTITAPNCNGTQCNGGKYRGLEIYNTGIESIYDVSTRYNGTLSSIIFRVPVPSSFADGPDCFSTGDISYTLTLNMATDDWRNHFTYPFISSGANGTNWATSSVVYVSYRKIYFTFQIPNSNTCIDSLYVKLNSTNISTTAFTGRTNWNLSNVTLTANFPTSSGGSSGGGSSGSGSTTIITDNTDVINNQNNNTSDIIDNANQNTKDIIDNQKELLGNCFKNYLVLGSSTDFGSTYGIGYPVNLEEGVLYTLKSYSGNISYKISTSPQGYTDTEYWGTNKSYFTFTYQKNSSNNNDNQRYLFISFNDSWPASSLTNKKILLTKGNYNDIFIDYNIERCISKIDETNATINSSTNTIIDNQTQNTQDIIDSNKVCKLIDKSYIIQDNKALDSSGADYSRNGFGITDYIDIHTSTLKVVQEYSSASSCWYDINKTKLSCFGNSTLVNGNLTKPDNAYYLRLTINKSQNKPQIQYCTNGNQALTDSLTDSNVDSSSGSDFFDNFNNDMHGLSSIITLPLNAITNLSSSTCSPLQFPIPFTDNKYLTLPCMTEIYQEHIPTLLALVQTLWLGIISYKILVDIFYTIKGFKDPDSDKIEVLDL